MPAIASGTPKSWGPPVSGKSRVPKTEARKASGTTWNRLSGARNAHSRTHSPCPHARAASGSATL